MAEIVTASPPNQQTSVVYHHEGAAIPSSINIYKEAFPSHERQHEHEDNKPALETEEFSELYDPNVYEGAFRHILTPLIHTQRLGRILSPLTPTQLRRPTN